VFENVPEKIVERRMKTNAPFGAKFGIGRQGDSGIIATVFGGTGFLGRYVLEELGSVGTKVYLPYRGCEMEVRHIKPMFDLGRLGAMPFSPRDRESILESIQCSDVVINLIGKHYETKHIVPTRRADGSLSRINYDFEDVNVRIPETIAELCTEAGVKCLIHVSALSADEESLSVWNQTKARGEIAVRNKFPEAIIVKPATMFGAEDRFLNYMAETSKVAPFFPLLNDGAAILQPVWAGDVAKGIMEIIYVRFIILLHHLLLRFFILFIKFTGI
jgi:nucleoside-diphosphate-sugar epimerase